MTNNGAGPRSLYRAVPADTVPDRAERMVGRATTKLPTNVRCLVNNV